MKFQIPLLIVLLGLSIVTHTQPQKTDILLLGSDHLTQLYKSDNPNTDVLLPKRKKELAAFAAMVVNYQPDVIMVEVLPESQKEIDSLYTLYLQNKLKLESLPDGRSEVYQLAFRIGKQRNLPKIYCVNAPGGTSQSVLDNGENIELYKKEGLALRAMVNQETLALQKDSVSLKDHLIFINQPETINKVYHLRYITPARVMNGTFKNPDALIDTAFVNPRYIGAELTSVFKNRDYKIYSNILSVVNKQNSKKALLIIGAAHIGSLKSIFRDDEAFTIIDANRYLRK